MDDRKQTGLENAVLVLGNIVFAVCFICLLPLIRIANCDIIQTCAGEAFFVVMLGFFVALPLAIIWSVVALVAVVRGQKAARRSVVTTLIIGPLLIVGAFPIWLAIAMGFGGFDGLLAVDVCFVVILILSDVVYLLADKKYLERQDRKKKKVAKSR